MSTNAVSFHSLKKHTYRNLDQPVSVTITGDGLGFKDHISFVSKAVMRIWLVVLGLLAGKVVKFGPPEDDHG
jgi:hypothetical protein